MLFNGGIFLNIENKQKVLIPVSSLKNYNFDAIFFNKDYTLYSKNRDENIEFFCNENDKSCNIYEDYLLLPIGNFLKSDGKPYEKYIEKHKIQEKTVQDCPKMGQDNTKKI